MRDQFAVTASDECYKYTYTFQSEIRKKILTKEKDSTFFYIYYI